MQVHFRTCHLHCQDIHRTFSLPSGNLPKGPNGRNSIYASEQILELAEVLVQNPSFVGFLSSSRSSENGPNPQLRALSAPLNGSDCGATTTARTRTAARTLHPSMAAHWMWMCVGPPKVLAGWLGGW
ncbi:uncharacterized protein LOC123327189 [Drosophila simulans]|uniref:Uncharacterized protein n=1 Tax=Drosophila simulans TaxID=7240 RepID=A0A0J9QV63_DROSI|nr:uncharacterized protein LOC123327189 [Drosophila simulans]KMY87699.1 uncharacterized protein Dsimw501_GD27224 [Drosophila simulans]